MLLQLSCVLLFACFYFFTIRLLTGSFRGSKFRFLGVRQEYERTPKSQSVSSWLTLTHPTTANASYTVGAPLP